jgi:hypothetical protein
VNIDQGDNHNELQVEMFSNMRKPVQGEPVLKSLAEELDELHKLEGDEAKSLRKEIGKKTMKMMTDGMPTAGRVQHYARFESPVLSVVTGALDLISWQHAVRSDGVKLYRFAKGKLFGGGSPSI